MQKGNDKPKIHVTNRNIFIIVVILRNCPSVNGRMLVTLFFLQHLNCALFSPLPPNQGLLQHCNCSTSLWIALIPTLTLILDIRDTCLALLLCPVKFWIIENEACRIYEGEGET